MSINLGSKNSDEGDVMIEMNMTPLIDVMLVLIIMLIITIPIQTHAVKLNMPVSAPPTRDHKDPEIVTIDVNLDGSVMWNGVVVPNRTTLNGKFSEIAHQPTQPEVHLRPNRGAHYKYVAAVMASAEDVGVHKIGLVEEK